MKYFSSNLLFLRTERDLTQDEMASAIGIERTNWSNYEKGKSVPNLKLFHTIAKYLKISEDDLLNKDLSNAGIAEKLIYKNKQKVAGDIEGNDAGNKPKNYQANDKISFVNDSGVEWRGNVFELDSKAAAGSPALLQDADKINSLPILYLPGLGAGFHLRIKITGDSMDGTVKDGDKVVCTKLTEPASMLREGGVHVILDKEDGIVCKRVYKTADPDTWSLESDNITFKPYKRHLNDILQVFKVVEVHSTDLHNYNTDTRQEISRLWSKVEELSKIMLPKPD